MKDKKCLILSLTIIILIMSCITTKNKNTDISKESYKKEYYDLLGRKKYDDLAKHLIIWKNQYPKDADVYLAYSNYYLNRKMHIVYVGEGTSPILSKDEIIFPHLQNKQLMVKDPKTNERVGSFTVKTVINLKDIKEAIKYVKTAIKLAPNRLDMHLVLINFLYLNSEHENLVETIKALLVFSKQINNRWLLETNPIEGPEEFLDELQRLLFIYLKIEKNKDSLIEISNEFIKNYPNSVLGYSNLGAIYSKSDIELSIKYYMMAQKIKPEDSIVLYNLAHLSETQGKYLQAIKYYKKLKDICNEKERPNIEEKINLLNKKINH